MPTAAAEHPQGLDVVFEGMNPIVDIVVIHGLNGHREKTWTTEDGVHWLRDLLPDDLPRARILCWGYDARTHANSGTSSLFLYDHARTLVSDLNRKRKLTNSSQRPIIFIAHSLGGIVLKSALIHSDAARERALHDQRSIKLSTYGILFMGTPHQGANGVHLGRILANVASLFVPADDRILKHLDRDSEWLLQQLGQYGPISGDFVTKFAYEAYETSIAPGKKIRAVPRASAIVPGQADAEPIAIHADHKNMVKFQSKESSGYITISETLQIMMMADLEKIIQARWEAEFNADAARRNKPQFSVCFSLSEVNEVDNFVAREQELAQMQKVLKTSYDRHTIIVHGLGGMGKTQLAIAFLKWNYERYTAVFWLNASDEETLRQSYLKAAERIRREHPSIAYLESAVTSHDIEEVVRAVKRWLNETSNRRWLIVYDNYDHPLSKGNGDQEKASHDAKRQTSHETNFGQKDGIILKPFDIRLFFPEKYHGAIIVTARSPAVNISPATRLRLGKLKRIEDSLEILEFTSNRKRLSEDPAAVQLARELDGLPLALSTAGAYLDQVSITCAEYLGLYQGSWSRLQKSSPHVSSYEDRAMYSTWNISYLNVERQNTSSAMLLKFWAYYSHEDLWYGLLCGVGPLAPGWLRNLSDKLTFVEAMRLLCNHGLVEANSPTKSEMTGSLGYSIHGCVHAWIIYVLNEGTDSEMAQFAVRSVAALVPDEGESKSWILERRLLQHADRCLEMISDGLKIQDSEVWIYTDFGDLYRYLGHLDKSEAMYKQAIQEYERERGPEHESTLNTINNLGLVYRRQGRLYGAEEILERSLQGKEKIWGPEHESTLSTANNLGLVYRRQGRLNEAEEMYKRALQGKEKIYGPDHISVFDSVSNLGNVYKRQDRLDEAEEMYQRALQGYEKAVGPSTFKTYVPALDSIENLGTLYRQQGNMEQARKYYFRAQTGFRAVLGDHHREVRRISEWLDEIST